MAAHTAAFRVVYGPGGRRSERTPRQQGHLGPCARARDGDTLNSVQDPRMGCGAVCKSPPPNGRQAWGGGCHPVTPAQWKAGLGLGGATL